MTIALSPRETRRTPLIDTFGRRVMSMRISLLDRCDLRCTYCMPASGLRFRSFKEGLQVEDWLCLTQVLMEMGIHHLRLTGGEPLLYPDLLGLIRGMKALGIPDLALTTNGTRLATIAKSLKEAGLDRLNISLDSLDATRFAAITRRDRFHHVWAGVEAALHAGLHPVRINVLLLAGLSEREWAEEFERWVAVVRTRPLEVRFLEQMPIGPMTNCASPEQPIEPGPAPSPIPALIARLETDHNARPAFGQVGNGPASYYEAPHWLGRIGFIRPLSEPYCGECSRFRITAIGDLRPCLSQELTIPLRAAIQTRNARAIEAGLREAAARKSFGHAWNEGIHTPTPMSTLGG